MEHHECSAMQSKGWWGSGKRGRTDLRQPDSFTLKRLANCWQRKLAGAQSEKQIFQK